MLLLLLCVNETCCLLCKTASKELRKVVSPCTPSFCFAVCANLRKGSSGPLPLNILHPTKTFLTQTLTQTLCCVAEVLTLMSVQVEALRKVRKAAIDSSCCGMSGWCEELHTAKSRGKQLI